VRLDGRGVLGGDGLGFVHMPGQRKTQA
jgi:hypothetical protein